MDKDEKQYFIRAEGEGDRTVEFKYNREGLVYDINDWLVLLAQKRDKNEPLDNGGLLVNSPRIVKLDLGPSSPTTNASVEEMTEGASLTGDGVTEPYQLQAVIKNSKSGRLMAVEVQGLDPLAEQFNSDKVLPERSGETRAIIELREVEDGVEQYSKFVVRGDGSVARSFLSEQGVHTTTSVRTLEELEMAQLALKDIQQTIV